MRSISSGSGLDQAADAPTARGQPAEDHQRLLHAVVHVAERLGVEAGGGRVDALVDFLRPA